ncbi:ATP-binding cassette domain-containing protein [uncultured Bacteroides sp.]|uniref:ABC transporter ATP-binding protein n=1 Tax=uncultured Bacteroides sp. TaxID=162156 RepID=UPI002AAAAA92|nr:ATP-binding cassette domain-containing protein [uncultured Bacteroides sp.]
MLKIEDACIKFGETELFTGLCMHIKKGEIVCISGESGSGKTSLLNAIMGFVPLKSGTITVDDLLLCEANIDQIRKKIAWIPQELALPCEWVSEMIHLPFSLKANRGVHFSRKKLFETFKKLNLEEELYAKRVSEISGGQRQRIMIAVAALLEKPILIIDEPTSALDTVSVERVLNFFEELSQKGITILSVSHDRAFKLGCNNIIYL